MHNGPREYHVSIKGSDTNSGAQDAPFRTIQAAADRAQPGDMVTVHEGVYREWVKPLRGGTSDDQRITFRAAPEADVVIKGSEPVTGWTHVEDNTWRVTIPNRTFGDYNPYNTLLQGAWYEAKRPYHTGAVYLNGHWLKEASAKGQVVKSEAKADDDGGARELMNIESLHTAGTPWRPATDFIGKSDDVEVVNHESGKTFVGRMKVGSYVVYEKDFGEKSTALAMSAASPVSGGIVEIRRDGPDGELLGKVDVGFTAEWHHFQVYHAVLTPLSGMNRICLVFTARPEKIVTSEKDLGLWFAEVDGENTTIWADFKGRNPNEELVEINVRKAVFYPEKEGMDYITVRGFTLEQAAAPWVAPTAEQVGLIGTHWSKGWVIEDNTIRYSVCVAVTLGKHGDEHDHTYDYRGKSIPIAVERGWDRVGHHVVRNNHIYHNGQGGIQGSIGCSFSTIIGNEIHDIRKDHEYGGCEAAGIKLHGAVDVLIKDNHVYNCEHWGGIWLDWMAQGARVTGNLLHGNSQDLMFEVNHGPYLVDNNILLSGRITEASGGGAFVHNLFTGPINIWAEMEGRHTPYFKPHSVEIIDSNNVDQNDDRFYNNLFTGESGTVAYDQFGITTASSGNVFLNGAAPSKHDASAVTAAGFDPGVKLSSENGVWWLEMKVDPAWRDEVKRAVVTSELLGKASRPDAPFEQRDGSPYRIDADYTGAAREAENPAPGPIAAGAGASLRIKVWPK